jgi:hypothetical protein
MLQALGGPTIAMTIISEWLCRRQSTDTFTNTDAHTDADYPARVLGPCRYSLHFVAIDMNWQL